MARTAFKNLDGGVTYFYSTGNRFLNTIKTNSTGEFEISGNLRITGRLTGDNQSNAGIFVNPAFGNRKANTALHGVKIGCQLESGTTTSNLYSLYISPAVIESGLATHTAVYIESASFSMYSPSSAAGYHNGSFGIGGTSNGKLYVGHNSFDICNYENILNATSSPNNIVTSNHTFLFRSGNSSVAINGARMAVGFSFTGSGNGSTNIAFHTCAADAVLTERVRITESGNLVIGSGIATNAAAGFLYIPSMAGAPVGSPLSYGSTVPIIYDRTNNQLCVYNSGVWKKSTFA